MLYRFCFIKVFRWKYSSLFLSLFLILISLPYTYTQKFDDFFKEGRLVLQDTTTDLSDYPIEIENFEKEDKIFYAFMTAQLYLDEAKIQNDTTAIKNAGEYLSRLGSEAIKSEEKNKELEEENNFRARHNLKLQNENFRFITAIISLSITLLGLLTFFWFRRYRLNIKENNIRLEGTLLGQEKEQKKIAKELHDGLGAELSIAIKTISKIKMDSLKEKQRDDLENGLQQLNDACTKLRNISHYLMPGNLQYGHLPDLIENYIHKFKQVHSNINIDFDYEVTIEVMDFSADTKLHIHRILQQGLNNIITHAQAKKIQIALDILEGNSVRLNIQDDGIGFDIENIKEQSSIGLKSMELRAKQLNGNLQIHSQKGKGTNISLVFPVT